jgi:cold shock CspA family protein
MNDAQNATPTSKAWATESLAEGARVEFETGPGRRGEEARNVRVV